MLKEFLLLGACAAAANAGIFTKEQAYGVKGKLLCGTRPASGIEVKLVDIDTGGPDDEMGKVYSSSNGEFMVSGTASDPRPTKIDPVLKIYHRCNDVNPCKRRWKIELPGKYTADGKAVKQYMDIGTLNLEVELDGEDHDCV